MNTTRMSRTVVALTLATGLLLGLAGAASAEEPPDVAGDRISWDVSGGWPCSDGTGGTTVRARATYSQPYAGTYQTRFGLYRSSDSARLGLGPLVQYSRTGTSPKIAVTAWDAYSSNRANAYVVAYVHRWNGSSWTLMARESIPCL